MTSKSLFLKRAREIYNFGVKIQMRLFFVIKHFAQALLFFCIAHQACQSSSPWRLMYYSISLQSAKIEFGGTACVLVAAGALQHCCIQIREATP